MSCLAESTQQFPGESLAPVLFLNHTTLFQSLLCEIYNSIMTNYFFPERTTVTQLESNAVFMTFFLV